MSLYNEKIGTGKRGINLIKSFVDENNCYFHEIVQENDVGIDAFIEFTKNMINDGRCIAVQIKNGDSYFNKDKSQCIIPIDNHLDYWANHSLDVYGIVCDYSSKKAYWISISNFIKDNEKRIREESIKDIKYPVMKINELNSETFGKIFKMLVYNILPEISFEETIELSFSHFHTEKELSLSLMMRKYANQKRSWDRCIDMLTNETHTVLLSSIILFLSYISGNPDLFGALEYSDETKQYAKRLLQDIKKDTIIKMLKLIPNEDGITRGSIGQCIESIISVVQNNINILKEIATEYYHTNTGIVSFLILSYYDPQIILDRQIYYEDLFGDEATAIIKYIKDYGSIDLYN